MSDTKPSNPKDAAATTRLDLSLFPATARAYGALALVEGDQKYGGYNYRAAGVRASVYYAACGRHLDKWFNGEECDPKTGVPHLANAIACLAVLIDGIEVGNWTDDRPPALNLAALLERCQEKVATLHRIFPRRAERYTQAAQAPSETPVEDAWIVWNGGECPVPEKTLVECRLRNGDTGEDVAEVWDWSHGDYTYDIVAYRVVKQA